MGEEEEEELLQEIEEEPNVETLDDKETPIEQTINENPKVIEESKVETPVIEKKKKGSKGTIIIILSVLILGVGGFFTYKFLTKEDSVPKEDNKQEDKQEEKKEEISKRVKLSWTEGNQQTSKETLNNITVNITVGNNNELISLTVNDKDIKDIFKLSLPSNENLYESIRGYEIYYKYVIFDVGFNRSYLIIYDTRDNTIMMIDGLSNDYFHDYNEYESDEKGLTIETVECSIEQCYGEDNIKLPTTAKVIDGLTYESGYNMATYRMDYVNGKFTEPKLLKQYTK